jgi:uncharacterized protein (DUF58 family)
VISPALSRRPRFPPGLTMLPSRRTYGILACGFIPLIALALLLSPSVRISGTIFAAVLFDVIVLTLMMIDGQRTQRVVVHRADLHRLSIGRDNPVELTVQSQGQPATIQIRDGYPATQFTVSQPLLQATLAADRSQTLTYTAHPSHRGEYAWGNIQVRQLSPWQLAWSDWQIPQPQTVAVYPDLLSLRALSIRLTLQSAGTIRQARRIGMGTEFAELREYATGDDPRLIDWKATARRSRPLVRVLEPEQEQTLIILLDRGRLMTAQVKGLQRFDWGLNATLSLALAGISRGDRVGVGVFDRTIHTWIPPERGQNHLSKIIERLTPIQPDFQEPDYLGAVNALVGQQSRRALVVMITDLVDQTASAELLIAMSRMAPRYLPFCVTLRDPQVDQQAQAFTPNISDTYARAVALDLLNQRQVAFADLKRRGVLVLDAPANQISDQLVDRYLQLKLRNQL